MNDLLNKLGVDETFTKPPQKQKVFNKVKDNIPLVKQANYMSDLLELPKTKNGFKYLLVVIDLATDAFDIEPIKSKESKETLNGLKTIFKRKWIKKPKVSITTDGGNEFKSVFNKFLEDENIYHKTALPYRHKQLGNVENLNKQLGRLLNGFMNSKEVETGKVYREWDTILPIIRTDLNKHRAKDIPNNPYNQSPPDFNLQENPKFKIGDVVYYKLDYPENALGNKQSTANFRVGDYRFSKIPKKIVNVLLYPKQPTFRYMLKDMPNVSYNEYELKLAKGETQTKYKVKEILGSKKIKGVKHYLIWWKNYKKADATWEPEQQLIEDGLIKVKT